MALTSKPLGKGLRVPLAGVPVASVEGHLATLVARGHRVAVCEQLDEEGLGEEGEAQGNATVPGKGGNSVRGLVRRGVVRVVSPGTALEPALLEGGRNNYCAALLELPPQRGSGAASSDVETPEDAPHWGLAAADLSTGAFRCSEFTGLDAVDRCAAELELLAPAELLRPEGAYEASGEPSDNRRDPPAIARSLAEIAPAQRLLAPTHFGPAAAALVLQGHYRVAAMEGLGLAERPAALAAAGALLGYLQESHPGAVSQLERPQISESGGSMRLDAPTLRALALFDDGSGQRFAKSVAKTAGAASPPVTLLGVLDRARTASGRRMMRERLGRPLLDLPTIEARLDRVQLLRERPLLRAGLREALGAVPDLERLLARAASGLAPPPEVARLGAGLEAAAVLGSLLTEAFAAEGMEPATAQASGSAGAIAEVSPLSATRLAELRITLLEELRPAAEAQQAITQGLDSRPAASFTEGGFDEGRVWRDGADAQCDAARERLRAARAAIAALEGEERRRSGIANLKVGYHRTFGYYLEVSKSGLARVPADYERRQTLAGGERFVTPALRALETKALEARETLSTRERSLFARLRRALGEQVLPVRALARGAASLDVDCALAEVAAERGYTRPNLDCSGALTIRAGRHPIVEAAAGRTGSAFIPNDIALQAGAVPGAPQLLLLTGPNMAGKSTYLRQTALIVLMAQCGSFVPAAEAHIGLVDRVFARVGAHDRLAVGQSTFMVEMLESAAILAAASERSLLVLDEIGRGTSTYDGLAVAQALLEYLVESGENPGSGSSLGGPRTLFATHFHELTALAGSHPRVVNAHVAVHEKAARDETFPGESPGRALGEAELRFLYEVRPGAADRSYGLQVAAMAGLPSPLLARAAALLRRLESDTGADAECDTGRDGALPAFLRKAVPDTDAQSTPNPTTDLAAQAAWEVADEMARLDVDAVTPLEAIAALYALRERARAARGAWVSETNQPPLFQVPEVGG